MIDTKALREKVLDLAIRGKLVPQDPNDEPATVLLERIREQKKQMVKDGKLKAKDIKNDTIIFKSDDNLHYEQFADGTIKCIENEIPFELPEGWSWSRFSSAFVINPRNSLTDDIEVSFVSMPMIQEEYANNHIFEERMWGKVKSGFTHFAENDIGVAKITPCFENKKSVVFKNLKNGFGAGTTELHIIRSINDSIYPEYVLWNIKTDAFITNGVNAFSGAVGQKRIGKDFIEKSLIPIAPTSEQKRIVERISIAFECIDEIDIAKEAFKLDIDVIKSKILDFAIRGKLVPQDPNDEPASVLLDRIRAEKEELIKAGKIKRDKKESVIFKGDDNSYYDAIPKSWICCRLGEVCNISNGYAFKSKEFSEDGIPVVRISDINNDSVNLKNCVYWNDSIDEKFIVKKGDLLIALSGATTGKMGVYKYDFPAYLNQRIGNVRVNNQNILLENYRDVFLMAMRSVILDNAYGAAQPNISSKQIEDLSIPLPPIAEQKRIVEAIETIFAQLDEIAESIA